jgi:addiction module HigA family antidote
MLSTKILNGRKRRPTHPGELLREDVLPALGMSQGEFASWLGVSRRTVNELLQERRPVSVDMAHRLARALKTSTDVWLNMQQAVDVWDALDRNKKKYQAIRSIPRKRAA